MSKQLKFKFKKILKKAEFIHADLEYHQELIGEAKQLFSERVGEIIKNLSAEDQQKIQEIIEQKQQATMREAAERSNRVATEASEEETGDSTSLVPTDIEAQEEETQNPILIKSTELKHLFHRIAEQTHPDKVRASGFSEKEVRRLERIFKKAREAYKEDNWYVLYRIGIELDIKMKDAAEKHIQWIEEDMRKTLGAIAQIGALVAWHWYVGDDTQKLLALKDYFLQAYGVTLS
jgi:hypothetical protein